MKREKPRLLFEAEPRRKARVMMHFTDAGPGYGKSPCIAIFECRKCNHTTDWIGCDDSELRRGVPCPKCNQQT